MGVGTWGTTTLADGRTAGALALPPVDNTVLERVVDHVNRVRAAQVPGVLRVVDLVSHANRVWLVTSTPGSPTVASLAGRLTQPLAAAVAVESGQALLDLHLAGLAHGALDASTVVLGPEGTVLLNEVGLAAALQGRPADAASDIAAWATLVRNLVPGDPILGAVATAAVAGLETALRVLSANTADLAGSGDRAAMMALLSETPVTVAAKEQVPAQSRTLLGRATPAPDVPAGAGQISASVVPAEEQATQLGRRRPGRAASAEAQPSGEEVMRFGPGVPSQTPVPTWATVATRPAGPRRRGRRITTVLTTVVTLAMVAVVGWALWQRYANPLRLTGVSVATTTLSQCDSKADVVATVNTNGRAGSFGYEWKLRLDDGTVVSTTGRLEQSVNSGDTSVPVHLLWSFSGQGAVAGTATITVLTPSILESSNSVTYVCRS